MTCDITPTGPCVLCKEKKIKCSLMPKNPETGKADRCQILREETLKYRLKQAEELRAKIVRGKQREGNLPNAGELSGLVSSPLEPLTALDLLTLDSGGSSTAIIPTDSLVASVQPPLPDPLAAASRPAPKTSKASNIGKYSSKSLFSSYSTFNRSCGRQLTPAQACASAGLTL